MSLNFNSNLVNTVCELLKNLPQDKVEEVVDFIEFLNNKQIKAQDKAKTSLQGIISNSTFTDNDLQEVKNIWKSQ